MTAVDRPLADAVRYLGDVIVEAARKHRATLKAIHDSDPAAYHALGECDICPTGGDPMTIDQEVPRS